MTDIVTHGGGSRNTGRRGFAGDGRRLYRGSLVSMRSMRFLACALSTGALCHRRCSFVSTLCPKARHAHTKAAAGIRAGKKEVCIMFMVPGGTGEHHTRAPCALAPTFQLCRRPLLQLWLSSLSDDPTETGGSKRLLFSGVVRASLSGVRMLLVSHRNLTRVFYCTRLQDPQAEPFREAKSQRLMSQSQRLMSDSCSRFCVSTPVHFLVLLRKGVATVKVHRLSVSTCDCDLKENWFLFSN